ncbi:hypothetical protein V8C35DRAFT_290256, partial [Trichoderma chlorosporum]
MYKRKFESDLAVVACKKAKIHTYINCPSLPSLFLNHPAFQAAPELLKKRKRSEVDSSDREARRIKSSHSGSNQSNPHILSPASKFQTFSKTADDSEEEEYWEGRIALPRSPTNNHLTTTAKETTTTTGVILTIRLARPQEEHSPALTSPSKKDKRTQRPVPRSDTKRPVPRSDARRSVPRSDTKRPVPRSDTKRPVPRSNTKQQVPRPRPYYGSILEMCDAVSDRFELDWVI